MKADLEWFRTFKAVFETGTMSEAAKQLNISQPGVSLHLNSLENCIGHPLFERNARRLVPTERARSLYQQLYNAVTQLERVEKQFGAKAPTERLTVSVGIFPGLFRQILEPLMPKLQCNLIVHMEDNARLHERLEAGTVDFIVTTDNMPRQGVVYQRMGVSHFILVAGSRTDLSGFPGTTTAAKEKLRQWLLKQLWYNTAERNHLNTFWKVNFGKTPDFVPNYILPDKYSIVRCLAGSVGVAIVPDALCREYMDNGRLHCLWRGYVKMQKTLYFAQNKKTPLADEIQLLKNSMADEFDKCHPML